MVSSPIFVSPIRIEITDEAQHQLAQIADYLDTAWSSRVRDNFLNKIETAVLTISQLPFAFPEAPHLPGVRRCVAHKHTSIYYRVNTNQIEVLAFWDNRQDIWSV